MWNVASCWLYSENILAMHGPIDVESKHIFYIQRLFLFENRALYEIMWKNILQPDRPQMTIWYMSITCWIHKATNTHLEFVTLIAFPLQQLFHERVSVLRYTYIASQILIFCWPCISIYLFFNIKQPDALNFIISLFQASTCFEHTCWSSGGQKLYYTVSGVITPIGVMIPETV